MRGYSENINELNSDFINAELRKIHKNASNKSSGFPLISDYNKSTFASAMINKIKPAIL